MCVCVYTRVRVCTCVRVCVYTYVRTCADVCACMYVWVCVCACVRTCVHMCVHACVCECLHVCARTRVCAFARVCVRTWIQSCPALCGFMDCNLPGSSVTEFSRQECWSRLPFPTPGDLPDPGIEPKSPGSAEAPKEGTRQEICIL